jgi:hypothetical protein
MNAVERVMMMQSCIASNGFMFGQGRLPFRPSWDVLKARLRREGLAPGARMVHGQAELLGGWPSPAPIGAQYLLLLPHGGPRWTPVLKASKKAGISGMTPTIRQYDHFGTLRETFRYE